MADGDQRPIWEVDAVVSSVRRVRIQSALQKGICDAEGYCMSRLSSDAPKSVEIEDKIPFFLAYFSLNETQNDLLLTEKYLPKPQEEVQI